MRRARDRQAPVRVFGPSVPDVQPTETPTEREFDYDRTVALSDGVFAIALTLLILNVANPEGGTFADRFSDVAPAVGAYALSFTVIGMLWMRHHALFRDMIRIDSRLTLLNLLYLGLVAFIPFPTSLLANQGSAPFSVVMYAGTMVLTSSSRGPSAGTRSRRVCSIRTRSQRTSRSLAWSSLWSCLPSRSRWRSSTPKRRSTCGCCCSWRGSTGEGTAPSPSAFTDLLAHRRAPS